MSEPVGIRELRHNTADIISAAEAGQEFHVTVRGKDTGVVIARQPASTPPTERRRGITLAQIKQAGLYLDSCAVLRPLGRGCSASRSLGPAERGRLG